MATPAVPAGSAVGQEATADQTTAPDAYVALGDSFTAGPLVPAPTGDPPDCGRSDSNYPHLAAAALEAAVFRDVSCSSARTDHLSEPQSGLVLGGTNPPQYDGLGPDVALVTVGIGGNDIGFGEIAQRCFQPPTPMGTPCSDYYTQDGRDLLSDRIAETAPKIAAALQGIRERSPRAEIVVVDYPAIMPHVGEGCYPYLPVLPEDVPYLRAKHEELNAMLAEQAAANGAHIVDTYSPSVGHDACQPPGSAWVNGIVVAPPSFPVHPNSIGMAGMAAAVLEVIERIGFAWPTAEDEEDGKDASVSPATLAAGASSEAADDVPVLPATGPEGPPVAGLTLAALAAFGLMRSRAPSRRGPRARRALRRPYDPNSMNLKRGA